MRTRDAMLPFDTLLAESTSLHGHMCPGQVLGVRMAMLGCRGVGIVEPKSSRDLLVYVEIDRCATDAIQAVTGCKLGRRTLKYVDLGKVAATFLHMSAGTAVRVVARDDSRDAVWRYAPSGAGKKEAQIHGYKVMPDGDLFTVAPVRVEVPAHDLPGHPVSRVSCESCGEGVNDRREVVQDGRVLCRACAHGSYYLPDDSAESDFLLPGRESDHPLGRGRAERSMDH